VLWACLSAVLSSWSPQTICVSSDSLDLLCHSRAAQTDVPWVATPTVSVNYFFNYFIFFLQEWSFDVRGACATCRRECWPIPAGSTKYKKSSNGLWKDFDDTIWHIILMLGVHKEEVFLWASTGSLRAWSDIVKTILWPTVIISHFQYNYIHATMEFCADYVVIQSSVQNVDMPTKRVKWSTDAQSRLTRALIFLSIFLGNWMLSIPRRMRLYVFMWSLPLNGGLQYTQCIKLSTVRLTNQQYCCTQKGSSPNFDITASGSSPRLRTLHSQHQVCEDHTRRRIWCEEGHQTKRK